MGYTYQQIFNEYGQYDSFVYLTFVSQSEAHGRYGETIGGTFTYERQERINLESNLKAGTSLKEVGRIRFIPSPLHNLAANMKEELERNGILNTDIVDIDCIHLRGRENRFAVEGQKELQNVITIDIPPSENHEAEADRIKLGMYMEQYRDGYFLLPEERYELVGLALYYIPNRIDPRMKEECADATGKFIPKIRFYELGAKLANTKLSDEEDQEYSALIQERLKERFTLLEEELKKSSPKIEDVAAKYGAKLTALQYVCAHFDTSDMRLNYEKAPIWWDFERFLHIYIRHVKETRVGEQFEGRSVFQYKFRDIKSIIEGVVKQVYPEFISHVIQKPNEVFYRTGTRGEYYDGDYYTIEIESNGRLRTFWPYHKE